ncbi:hypothetical protein [Sphingomonas sp. YR710]|uniref:hypothetical protein n=1 Tax=Sphingomonas sp. YR710 TaxID=1882773 RepID=UPI00115FCD1C|nr:hypothetical protein [Sphingomonas sp. YR710]
MPDPIGILFNLFGSLDFQRFPEVRGQVLRHRRASSLDEGIKIKAETGICDDTKVRRRNSAHVINEEFEIVLVGEAARSQVFAYPGVDTLLAQKLCPRFYGLLRFVRTIRMDEAKREFVANPVTRIAKIDDKFLLSEILDLSKLIWAVCQEQLAGAWHVFPGKSKKRALREQFVPDGTKLQMAVVDRGQNAADGHGRTGLRRIKDDRFTGHKVHLRNRAPTIVSSYNSHAMRSTIAPPHQQRRWSILPTD